MKLITVVAVSVLVAVPLCAQTATGRITGRVTDPSGSVVAGAAVKAANILTNVGVSTRSTSEGIYDILNLIPGQYRLEVDMPGFKHYSRGPIELRVEDVLTIPVGLEVGSQTESVTVNAAAPLLDTSETAIGQVTDLQRVVDLPLPANNPLIPSMWAVNVTSLLVPDCNCDPSGNNGPAEIAAVGTIYGQSGFAIDGMPSMDQGGQAYQGGCCLGIVPPPEILQEVKISATPYDASLGHFTGAMENMVTKSGTNGLHGALVFYNTNSDLDAQDFFTKLSIDNPATGPVTHAKIRQFSPYISYNRYRGVIGGPLVIPKLYNGRNRTFWMYAGDYFYEPYTSNGFYTVPTAAERTGNFSALLAIGSSYQIYDPYSAVATAGGHVSRSPLAGNIIPPNFLSPVAQNLLKYYRMPNTTGTADGLNNYTGVPNSTIDQADHFGRVDQVVTDNDRLFVSYNRSCILALQNRYLGGEEFGIKAPTGAIQNNCHQGATLDNVFTPSPSWVVHFAYGLVRYRALDPSTSQGVNLSTLGLPPQLIAQVPASIGLGPASTLPSLSITNVTGIGSSSGSQNGDLYHAFFGSVTHIVGAHSIKVGGELRVTAYNYHSYGNLVPSYAFNTSWMTATDTSAAAPSGQALASFLYGLPSSGSISRNDTYAQIGKMVAWYVQDDWKVTRRLTLNLGIRHELEFGSTVRYNNANRGFDFTDPNPVQAAAQAAYALNPLPQLPASQFQVLGGLNFLSASQRSEFNLNPANFMPRIGLAYQVNSNTVIRGGFGIFFESFLPDWVYPYQNGYSQSTSMVPSINNGLSFRATLDSYPFPDGILQPTGSSLGLATFLGKSMTVFNPGNHQAYDMRWSLNIQHQFGSRVLVDVGYTGNRADRLGTNNAWDSLPVRFLSYSPFRDTATINALGAQVPNPFAGIAGFATTALANPTVAVSQLLLPYPEFTGVSSTDGSGFAWYDGFSVRVEKRMSHGFTVQGNYTWSKFMTANSHLNGIESPLAHSISVDDRPQQFSPNAIYELPFGKGRHFLASARGWQERVVGGWQVQTFYVAQSGAPMAFGNVLFLGNLHNIVLPKSQRSIAGWFNVNAGFNTVASQQLANNYRTFPAMLAGARSPGLNLVALSVIKRIRITEKTGFEIHAEAKNAFNHNNPGAPNLTPTSTLFGQITSDQGGPRVITFLGKLTW